MNIELEHYAFALFIAGLICLIAILCKVLFSNIKKQYKLLDEKETKLLQLYQTVENIMEEFTDQAKATTDEIKEYENRLHRYTAIATQAPVPQETVKPEPAEKPSRSVTVDSTRIRAASEVLQRAERIIKSDTPYPQGSDGKGKNGVVFQRFFDDTVSEEAEAASVENSKQSREKAILALSADGKTEGEIASELGITRNEVKLVIGLKRT